MTAIFLEAYFDKYAQALRACAAAGVNPAAIRHCTPRKWEMHEYDYYMITLESEIVEFNDERNLRHRFEKLAAKMRRACKSADVMVSAGEPSGFGPCYDSPSDADPGL